MNKQLPELWTKVCKEEMPELDETCMTLQRQKKFAELIVKECMSCCDVVKKVEWIDPPTYELGVEACKVKIQTHFGVEQ